MNSCTCGAGPKIELAHKRECAKFHEHALWVVENRGAMLRDAFSDYTVTQSTPQKRGIYKPTGEFVAPLDPAPSVDIETPAPSESILLTAESLVNGDRAKAYGHPSVNWSRTVEIFNAMTGLNLTAEQGVKFAIAMKLARLHSTPNHLDSIIDLAGYAWVLSKVTEE